MWIKVVESGPQWFETWSENPGLIDVDVSFANDFNRTMISHIVLWNCLLHTWVVQNVVALFSDVYFSVILSALLCISPIDFKGIFAWVNTAEFGHMC